ncbi:hypothetical protein V8E36_006967 [Tilletia maclaganii]
MSFSRHHDVSPNPVPPIYKMQQRLLLDRSLFAFSLPRAAHFEEYPETEGKLTIGAIDYSACNEALRYNQVILSARYQDLWVVRGMVNRVRSRMILDTGSSFIVLPLSMARVVFTGLGLRTEEYGTSLIAWYLCRHYPFINIRTSRSSIVLHPSSMKFGFERDGWCLLNVIGADQEDVTLGRPFFENAYTVIDLAGRVSFCRLRGDEDTVHPG